MNSRILVAGVISVIVFGTLLFSGRKEDEKVEGVQNQVSAKDERVPVTLDSQLKSMGAVEVEVTPVSIEPGSNMIFDISLNTHSVELSYDYTKIISIQDNLGNEYEALSWSSGEGGHHLRGQIELEPILQEAGEITLIIDDIDDQKETFEWSL